MPKAPKTFGSISKRHTSEWNRGTKRDRGYGGEWEKISLMFRQDHPVCQVCNDAPSMDTDHIVPFTGINDPLRTDWNNLQAVCRKCHNVKTSQGR